MQPSDKMPTADFSRPHASWGGQPRLVGLHGSPRSPQTPTPRGVQVHVYKYSRVRRTREEGGRAGGRPRAGAGGPRHHWNAFSHTPAPSRGDSLADHLAQLVHILEQHVVVGHGPEGTVAAAWRAPKTGVGAPKSSVPGPWLASSPQDPRALGAEDTRAGRRGPETAAPSSAGDRPGAGGRAGALERGRPGPGAARPPAAPRAARAALPGVRILGDRAAPRSPLVSPRGPRGRDRSLGRGRLRRGAGQLGLQGGPRQDHGGKIAAEGGGGGRSALGTRRRRQRRSLLLLLLLPPPPARLGVGGGFAGLALRAGGSRGRRLQLLLRRLGRRPAREPRAPSSRTRALLPLRPHGFQNHRPRPLQPVGRRWPRERARA